MNRILLTFLLFCCAGNGFGQTYFPMPSADATWRYRFVVIDDGKDVTDVMLFLSGTDTVSGGNTYHRILSRSYIQHIATSAPMPPVVDATASISDIYYGAYREVDKKIYTLSASGEQKVYDFNAAVGSAIPGYSGLITVMSIDSILLDDGYHKRYKTTDTGYSVIEGVGSSRGLIPQLISGTSLNKFLCFKHSPEIYFAPMGAGAPCTYIAQLIPEAVGQVATGSTWINVYPVPAKGILHITSAIPDKIEAQISDGIGRQVWQGTITDKADIDVGKWPKGIYFLVANTGSGSVARKIMVE